MSISLIEIHYRGILQYEHNQNSWQEELIREIQQANRQSVVWENCL